MPELMCSVSCSIPAHNSSAPETTTGEAMNRFLGDTSTLTTWANEPQGKRLLRMRFPRNNAPPRVQLLANTLEADEYLSRSFKYTVGVLSDNARLALADMLGKLVVIDLVREDGTLRHFSGHVFAFSLTSADGGFACYTMVLGPWLDFLKLGEDCIAFHNLNLIELTRRVFADYLDAKWTYSIGDGDAQMTYVCQHNESHYNLLHRLWEARGWICYYEHGPDGHTLWLLDGSAITDLPLYKGRPQMRFHDEGGSAEDDGIHDWQPWHVAASGKATATSTDFKTMHILESEGESANGQGHVIKREVRENRGAYPYKDRDGGNAEARLRIEEMDAGALQFRAKGNDRLAEPIRTFWLEDHFSAPTGENPASTKYLIVSVHHEASNNYLHGRGVESDYSNRFTCVLKRQNWRLGRGLNSTEPRVVGVQTAIVVGPPGEEIYTDNYGRVKVQFHWDRLGKRDHMSSPWVRVMTGWAGSRFGQISVPRVGMEVVIQFIEGDLSRPLIIGAVYNEYHMPPWPLPENKTQSGILTRSTKGGTDSTANALRFEDARGAEELWLHAEKDQRIEVEHDESHWVGHDRRKNVDHDETVVIKNDRTETVGHDEKITVHNDRNERVDHNEQIDIGDHRKKTIGGNETVKIRGGRLETITMAAVQNVGLGKLTDVGGAYSINVGLAMTVLVGLSKTIKVLVNLLIDVGKKVSILAGEEFTVTVGDAALRMKSSGEVHITATMFTVDCSGPVQINGKDVDVN
jgi:type VI secretion system secreted protein VgrG